MLFLGSGVGFSVGCLGFFNSSSSVNNADCLDHTYIIHVNFIVLYIKDQHGIVGVFLHNF